MGMERDSGSFFSIFHLHSGIERFGCDSLPRAGEQYDSSYQTITDLNSKV